MSTAETEPAKVGDSFERYQILGLLGQGGYATVYHARREFIDREVALKISNRSVTREVFRRFQAEARLTNRLKHPNIVEIIDADVAASGHLFIAMELLRGQTFLELLRKYRRLTVHEALWLCAQVADGVEQAHCAGAIHRDLKPANLFVIEGNRVKVLDFGIAKISSAEVESTRQNVIHGTLRYMSPEQLQLQKLRPQSDVYALGTVLFELLTGQHPMILDAPEPNMLQLSRAIITKPAPFLHEIDSRISPSVSLLIHRALAKQPADRFESMALFARAMRDSDEQYVRESGIDDHSLRSLWLEPASTATAATTAPATFTQPLETDSRTDLIASPDEAPATRTSPHRAAERLDDTEVDQSPHVWPAASDSRTRGIGRAQRGLVIVACLIVVGVVARLLLPSGGVTSARVSPQPSSRAVAAASGTSRNLGSQSGAILPAPSAVKSSKSGVTSSDTVATATPRSLPSARPTRTRPNPNKKLDDRLDWFTSDSRAVKP